MTRGVTSAEDLSAPLGNFQEEWSNAAKGDLKTTCDFDYSGRMMEMMMLGLAAYRAGVAEKVDYDPEKGLTNNDAVNRHLSKTYREGWPIDA